MVDLIQRADDSNGTIGCVIDLSLERIQEIIQKSEQFSRTDKEMVFQLLLEESRQSRYDGWSDWQLVLIEFASRLTETDDLRRKWEQHVSKMASEQKGGDWSNAYFAERIAVIRYALIKEYEEEWRAEDYLISHLHFSDFREMAIQDAFHNDRYDEVIRLAEEGEAQDEAKGNPGLVKKWKAHRYEAYSRSGQLKLQRKLGVEFVLDGSFPYYKMIKDSYSAAEWRPVYQEMLQELEKDKWPKEVYTRILVEEREFSRLLLYVKKQPSRIEQFYTHLNHQFPLDVKELFLIHIEAEACQATTRSHYNNVCRIIHLLQQAGGKDEALQIARLLLAKYPKKPAFRDELLKLNYH